MTIGRRLLAQECGGGFANYVDLTAEFSEPSAIRKAPGYFSFPILDGAAPRPEVGRNRFDGQGWQGLKRQRTGAVQNLAELPAFYLGCCLCSSGFCNEWKVQFGFCWGTGGRVRWFADGRKRFYGQGWQRLKAPEDWRSPKPGGVADFPPRVFSLQEIEMPRPEYRRAWGLTLPKPKLLSIFNGNAHAQGHGVRMFRGACFKTMKPPVQEGPKDGIYP
jgi:hypothetical protein